MKTESLATVMIQVLRNNRQVAKSLVEAYRNGSTRLIEKGLADRFGGRGQKAGHFLIQGIDKASDSAEDIMARLCNRACGMVEKMDDNKYTAKYLGLVGKVTLPGARMVSNLSGKLVARVASKHKSAGTGHRAKSTRRRPLQRRAAAAA